jgi:D-alanyl-D-alanine carboxypeptidase
MTRQLKTIGVAVVIATVSAATSRGTVSDSPALKPISQGALQALVDSTARELLVPGAVVLLRTPQHEFVARYGTTQLGTMNRPGVDTYFRIASNTKTMTAAVILQLAQEGLLSLSDPIAKYVPHVPNGDNITIAELLEMRSGLYNYSNAPELSAAIDRDHAKIWTTDELLRIAFARPPNFPPRTKYEYCNTNYVLLGLVAERVGNKPLALSMEERLFRPLGMQQTLLPAGNVNTMPEPYSHGYLYGSSSVALVGTPPYSSEVKAAAQAGSLLPTDYTDVSPSSALAPGGVISTANDLATWIQALVGGRVLNAEYQARWRDSLQPEGKPDGQEYGYGIIRIRWGGNEMLFHGGETVGYQSFIGDDPTNKVTLVIWTNLAVSLDEKLTANELMLKVLDYIYVISPLRPSSTTTADGERLALR